ncbi:techylectin-5B-like [Mercenaria mercenaria]|uniref:techylectin-5B-like n=1 Tax=Mercenaria mercenaria TaxID=6596 RepID=UPI00234EBEAF|nr:techylectin-5B-like [Mercenaria mercenaria]
MEKLVIYFVFLLFSGAHKILAYTSDHTMDRLDYMEDRLNAESARINAESSRLNAESKVRKKEFNILYNKLGHIETMLHNVIEMKETKSDTFRFNERTGAVSGDKMKTLLNAFKEEKFQNIRFRREISYDMRKQTEHLKKAYERNENSLNNISREVELLRQEVVNQHVDSKETANHFQQNIEEHIQDLRPPVNFTKETVETISSNVETLKEQIANISVNLQNGIHFQNTCPGNALGEKLEVTSVQPVKRYKSCLELYNNGFKSNGAFDIEIHQSKVDKTVVPIYCDMATDNGGWTVFQRRQDGSVDFYRDWNDYKYGFGQLDGEFWLGNEYVNILTDDGETHELRIDLEDHEGSRAYAKYSKFKVGPESTNYKLEVSGYSGDAGDSLFKPKYNNRIHNGMQFSTKDRDNDQSGSNCASNYNGAWWFNECFASHLNGLYQSKCYNYDCIIWYSWKGWEYSLKFTEMKFR